MDPNDIYSLAQQAGVVDPSTPSYADYQDSSVPPSSFTDEDMMAHFVPQDDEEQQKPSLFQSGPQLTPPTPPGLADPQSPAAPLGSSSSMTKTGGSVAQSGFSPSKNAQVRRGPGAVLDQNIANIEQQGQAQKVTDSQNYLGAAQEEKDAAHAEAVATADYATAEGHEKAILASLQQNFDTQTEKLIGEHQAQAAESKARYVAALNDFRAARVDPSQLWDNLGAGGRFGMQVAAFVQDFLGAQGISTSAMATFNKAIDRNLDSQIQAIKQKGQVADGFKTLWDMQMAESHSVEEARTRMRGFMLDAAKTGVEAHLAQFNAALATAKGQVAVAKLDQELAKNIFEVNKHVDSVTASKVQQLIQRYGDELRASMESARIAVDRERLDIERQKAAREAAVDPIANLIPDNSESGGGYARWEFNNPKNTELNNKYLEKQGEVDNTLKLIRQYQSLQRLYHNNQGLAAGTRWGSAEDQQLKALATEILGNRLLEKSGKAATNEERKALEIGTPQALFSGTLKVDKVLALTENIERQSLDSMRDTVAHELHPADPRRKAKLGASGHYGELENKEATAIATGADKVKSPEQKERDKEVQQLEGHSAMEPVDDEVGADVKADHEHFLQTHPDAANSISNLGELDSGSNKAASKPILKYEKTLSRLKTQAVTNKEKNPGLYSENVDLLRTLAGPVVSGTNPDDSLGQFAVQMLQDMGEDPGIVTSETPPVEGASTAHEELDPHVILPPIPKKKRK